MLQPDAYERREFIRVTTEIPVAYKFFSTTGELEFDDILEGVTSNISRDGMLLQGKHLQKNMAAPLLLGKIVIGVNLFLPNQEDPVKALSRVKWIEAGDEQGADSSLMGLNFKEITKESIDKILKFIISTQMP